MEPIENNEEELVKVYVDLPNHPSVDEEALWAVYLGGGEYELRNVPMYAYSLNYLDVVLATAEAGGRPTVKELVEPSGHTTHRLIFYDQVPEEERIARLDGLQGLGVSYEGEGSYFALDLEPEADFDALYERLDAWVEAGEADYETCEARVEGSFDADPDEAEEG